MREWLDQGLSSDPARCGEQIAESFGLFATYTHLLNTYPDVDPFFQYRFLPFVRDHPSSVNFIRSLLDGRDNLIGYLLEIQEKGEEGGEAIFNRRRDYFIEKGIFSQEYRDRLALSALIPAAQEHYAVQKQRALEALNAP